MPIFIMRPLRGEFEHATQGAVNRLRVEGDTSVFWLDTSGWLDTHEDTESAHRDFELDDDDDDNGVGPSRWRLTERGNQRVAIFLHLHVCRYLAVDQDQCTFLAPQIYEGRVFDPESAAFDQGWEEAKERKLKEVFWNE